MSTTDPRAIWMMTFLSLCACLLLGLLIFGQTERHIEKVDWASLLRDYSDSIDIGSNHQSRFQFRQTKFLLSPKVYESSESAAEHWDHYYASTSRAPHLTVTPLTSEFGQESYWVSGLESTFTKLLRFHRQRVDVWLYYEGKQEDARALASLIDERLKSDRKVAPIVGTPVYIHLMRRLDEAQRAFYIHINGPPP